MAKYDGMQGAWIVVRCNGKVFVTRRSPATKESVGKWNWVGGGVDKGETPEQAAIREFIEEAGVDMLAFGLEPKPLLTIHNKISGGTCHFFTVEVPALRKDEFVMKMKFNDEQDRVGWIDPVELANKPEKCNWPTLASIGSVLALQFDID